MALTDSDGNLIETYEYDVFGAPTITLSGATNNRFLFGGYDWDTATALYNYGDVAYDPVIGCLVQGRTYYQQTEEKGKKPEGKEKKRCCKGTLTATVAKDPTYSLAPGLSDYMGKEVRMFKLGRRIDFEFKLTPGIEGNDIKCCVIAQVARCDEYKVKGNRDQDKIDTWYMADSPPTAEWPFWPSKDNWSQGGYWYENNNTVMKWWDEPGLVVPMYKENFAKTYTEELPRETTMRFITRVFDACAEEGLPEVDKMFWTFKCEAKEALRDPKWKDTFGIAAVPEITLGFTQEFQDKAELPK